MRTRTQSTGGQPATAQQLGKHRFGVIARSALAVGALGMLASACGGDSERASAGTDPKVAATVAPAPSVLPVTDQTTPLPTAAPVDTTPATLPVDLTDLAAKGAETTVPVTTVAPTTVPIASLPIPIPAPVDTRGQEPIINLGTIEIPKIGLNTTLYEGIRLTTLDRGPGHWPGTAMPGQVGNSVIAGHRVSHDKPFRNVDRLVAGDEVVFTTADGRFVYQVTSLEIVTPDAIRIIDQTAEKTATLFACHPPGSTRERIVVHLALVEG